MLVTNCVSFIFLAIAVEAFTEMLINPISIINKYIWYHVQCCKYELIKDLAGCGYCLSFWVSLIVCLLWVSPRLGMDFWFSVLVVWRASNWLNTLGSYILKAK